MFWAIRPVRSAYLIYIDCPEGIQKMNEDLIGNQFGSHQEGFSFRVPTKIRIVDAIAKTSVGKIDKKNLRLLFAQ